MRRFVVISECSSSGKSSLLAELGRRSTLLLKSPAAGSSRKSSNSEAQRSHGWTGPFTRRCIALALSDLRAARRQKGKWVFFDRGLIDASAALEHLTGEPTSETLRRSHRFYRRVFLAPLWPEIYVLDRERRHSLETALVEYSRLAKTYPSLSYETVILPKVSVAERADFILNILAE